MDTDGEGLLSFAPVNKDVVNEEKRFAASARISHSTNPTNKFVGGPGSSHERSQLACENWGPRSCSLRPKGGPKTYNSVSFRDRSGKGESGRKKKNLFFGAGGYFIWKVFLWALSGKKLGGKPPWEKAGRQFFLILGKIRVFLLIGKRKKSSFALFVIAPFRSPKVSLSP